MLLAVHQPFPETRRFQGNPVASLRAPVASFGAQWAEPQRRCIDGGGRKFHPRLAA
jgi:hypothetical protein